MENTYWFRYFLIINDIANNILQFEPQNFAKLIVDEGNGVYANSQMTNIFYRVNESLCKVFANEEDMIFEENDINELAKLTIEQLNEYYNKFVDSQIELKLIKN